MAALVLQEAPRQSKSSKETENCLQDIAVRIKGFFRWDEPRDWRKELSAKMAELPFSTRDLEELEQIMIDRLAQGSLGYRRKLQEGLIAFLSQSPDVPSKACKPITDGIEKSLQKHNSFSKELDKKLGSVETTSRALKKFYKWCKDKVLPGTKGSESDASQRSELVQSLVVLANVSNDPCRRKFMEIVATAFSQPCESRDLNNWLLCLGPANKVILDWTDLLPKDADRGKIERRMRLMDQARLEIDPVQWETALDNWVAGATPGEKRLEAAKTIKDNIKFGFKPVYTWEASENVLKLNDLHLKTLPGAIGLLKDTKWLMLENNKLESLPASVGLFTELVYIDLTQNNFKRLPESIEPLTKITNLGLSYNKLKTLPAWIESLTLLCNLPMTDNNFRTFPRITLPKLKWVNVEDRDVKKLRESIRMPDKVEIWTESSSLCGSLGKQRSASCQLL
jgi:Leucine rich repeat